MSSPLAVHSSDNLRRAHRSPEGTWARDCLPVESSVVMTGALTGNQAITPVLGPNSMSTAGGKAIR